MTAAVVDTTLGELLSPSQVNTFLSCPAKWYFRYCLGLKEPATGSKTASLRPAGITADYGLQLTTYSMITPGATGACRLDTVTKTLAIQLVQQSCTIGAEERRYAETIYPMVQDGMRDGIYTPRRGSPTCSRRYCGHWRECEREYGGRVPG